VKYQEEGAQNGGKKHEVATTHRPEGSLLVHPYTRTADQDRESNKASDKDSEHHPDVCLSRG
jgi:hypothetical protein